MNIFEELENRALEFVSLTNCDDMESIEEAINESLLDDWINYYGKEPVGEIKLSHPLSWEGLFEKMTEANREEQDYSDAKEEARIS